MPKLNSDLDFSAATPEKSRYPIPEFVLQAMVLALARPAAGAADTVWTAIVQGALDQLDTLDPRDAMEATFAIQIIAANAGMLDALRLAFEVDADTKQALRQRASASALARGLAMAARLLKEQRARPAGEARDWGGVLPGLASAWQVAVPRPAEVPRGAKAAAVDAEPIIKWIDELTDAEVEVAVEVERREKAGEPPLPAGPGPKVVYRYKPDDYALRWQPDPRAWRAYPGWENMTMCQRREFFELYTYTGPLGPIEALSPAGQIAMLADQAEEAVLVAEYGM